MRQINLLNNRLTTNKINQSCSCQNMTLELGDVLPKRNAYNIPFYMPSLHDMLMTSKENSYYFVKKIKNMRCDWVFTYKIFSRFYRQY